MSNLNPEPQSIEQLRDRYARLNEQRNSAKTQLALAQQKLELAQKQAREQYGTDDLAELEAKLEQWRRENEEKRRTYQAELDAIEADLAAVKKEHDELS